MNPDLILGLDEFLVNKRFVTQCDNQALLLFIKTARFFSRVCRFFLRLNQQVVIFKAFLIKLF